MVMNKLLNKEPPFFADNLALDLVNTVVYTNGERFDFLQSDTDAIQWMRLAKLIPADYSVTPALVAESGLLHYLKKLRTFISEQLDTLKNGQKPDVKHINQLLSEYPLFHRLEVSAEGEIHLVNQYVAKNLKSLFYPVVLATAQLMTRTDIHLFRQCEHEDCILWFEDKTKAHKRRWCSMTTCGNKHKVTQFRKRNATSL